MQVFRICLRDKSSILIERESLEILHQEIESNKFIQTRENELILVDYIWCIRKSKRDIEKN